MGYSPELIARMRRLHFYEHYTLHATSKVVGLHRDTVQRILYKDSPPQGSPERRPSILYPYVDIIEDHLKRYPGIRGTKLLRIIQDRGYEGSLNTLHRYLRPLRKKHQKTFKPMSYIAGEQGQVDWAHFGKMKVAGGERKLYLFVMVLSYSRAIYAEFTFDISTDSFLRLHERAFSFFGGAPRKLLYDNLKSAVAERIDNTIRFNARLHEFAGFYGFEPAACKPYAGNQKGRVERAIRYIRDNFAGGYQFSFLDESNRDIRYWLDSVTNIRPWPQGKDKTVAETWEEERSYLLKPLSENKFHAMSSTTARSSKHGLIRFDLNDYSIPSECHRELVTLEADDDILRIYRDHKLVCQHSRSWERGQRIMTQEHWQQKSNNNKRHYREFLLQVVPELADHLKVLIARGEQKHHMLKQFFNLYKLYGEQAFRATIIKALEEEKHHPEQISKLLIKQEKDGPLQPKPIAFTRNSELSKLHIKSHSLDNYDLF